MTYADLAAQQIRNVGMNGPAARQIAPACHALMFEVFEEAGLGLFQLKQRDVVQLVYEKIKVTKWWGPAVNGVILRLITALVAEGWKWLTETLENWLAEQRAGVMFGSSSTFNELNNLFQGAREVRASLSV